MPRVPKGQQEYDTGEAMLSWRMADARKLYPVRIEDALAAYAKELGNGNLSLGIRTALYRQRTSQADQGQTPTKKRKPKVATTPKKAKRTHRPATKAKRVRVLPKAKRIRRS